MNLLIRWVISGLAIFLADWLIPGIEVSQSGWVVYAIMAVILGLINAVVRPVLKFLSCPLILLTLGLFTIVINAATFMLASYIAESWLKVGFHVDSFWSALLGSIVVSIVTVLFNLLLKDDNERPRKKIKTSA
jgi:putative membrane protein